MLTKDLDIADFDKLMSNTGKVIKEIAFSDKESRIKDLHYSAFKKLPKAEKLNYLGGIPIIEDKEIPPNMFVLRYNNPIYNHVFMLVDDKLMDLGSMRQFINKSWGFNAYI